MNKIRCDIASRKQTADIAGLSGDTVRKLRKHSMQDERSTVQKIKSFLQAFSEFLRRPKTIFDIKDRFRLLVLFVAVIAVLEWVLYYFENVK